MSGGAGSPWGREGRPLVSLETAWDAVARDVTPMGITSLSPTEALGRVLARPVISTDDCPSFDKAMMDGFAVRAEDCAVAGTELKVVGLAPAGASPAEEVAPGRAVRINTGAPVPPGADAVVKIEDTTPSSDRSTVIVRVGVRRGLNIVPQGSDRRQGAVVLSPPMRLGAAQLAAAVSAGVHAVQVYQPVGVAIVVTGDELLPLGARRTRGQIVESNGPMLAALMRQFGAEPCEPRIARDTPTDLNDRIAEALRHPVVLVVGGMSMGTLDLVPQACKELGVHWAFHGVSVKPGKPVAYGRGPDGQHVFGLPGNPVSVFVCAWLFVRMVIRGMQGFLPPSPPRRWRATLTAPLGSSIDPRPSLLPARVWSDAQRGMMAEACPWGGSGDLFGLALGDALLLRPDPTKPVQAGDAVEVILLSDAD